MNKMKFMLFAVAAMAAASCVKETAPEGQDNPASEVNYVQMEFTVDTKTKTAIAEDGATVLWNKGDKICVFDNSATAATNNNQFEINSGVGTSTAVITGSVPEDATEFYAYYPYNANRTFADGVVVAKLDQDQKVRPGTFYSGVSMMAKADDEDNFQFKNVCSHIKFTLTEELTDIASITLIGNNFETLTGYYNLDWNDGNPRPTGNKTPNFPYVNLLPASGETMGSGDYYFTFLPVNFKNGFTIILTKTDGTQVARKTTKNFDLSAGNVILPLKPRAANDFQEYTNYYLMYITGKDITIGGYTFNKTTHSKATVVSDTENITTLTNDGLYFINPIAKGVDIKGTHSSYMVIGMEKGCRVPTTLKAHVATSSAGKELVLANLNVTGLNSYDICRGCSGSFGSIILNNCTFKDITRTALVNFAAGTIVADSEIKNISIEDCEIIHNKTTDFYIIRWSASNGKWEKVSFVNNVVTSKITDKDTRLTYGTGVSIDNLSCVNNTFDVTMGGIICHCKQMTSISFLNNLVVSEFTEDGSILEKDAANGAISNNYYYTGSDYGFLLKHQFTANLDYTAPIKLSASPLNKDFWNPANGTFGAYTITPVEGEAPTVPVGAQRADMAVQTSSVNSPAADYKTADLGTF